MNTANGFGGKRYRTRLRPLWKIGQYIAFVDLFFLLVFFLLLAGVYWVCTELPRRVPGFGIDYGFKGILLPVLISLGTNKQQKILGAAVGMCILAMGNPVQWYSLLALPLLLLYSGQRGKGDYKYLFYIYSPLHRVVLHGVNWIQANTHYLDWLKKLI